MYREEACPLMRPPAACTGCRICRSGGIALRLGVEGGGAAGGAEGHGASTGVAVLSGGLGIYLHAAYRVDHRHPGAASAAAAASCPRPTCMCGSMLATSASASGRGRERRSRVALPTTDRGDTAIPAAAVVGESRAPKNA